MAKYINKFNNQGEYESKVFNLDYPNINYIESGDTVVWQKTKPPHMVEISNGSTTWYGGVLKSGQSNEITRAIVTEMNVTSINECTSLVISDGVTSIGDEAFKYGSNQYPSSVEHLVLPSSVTSFGNGALYAVGANITPSSEEMIDFSNNVEYVGENAFYLCPFIRSANLTNPNFTGITNYAFQYCTSLTSITIGSNVTSIGAYAFAHCSGLTSITIPDSVASISMGAFNWCSGLTSVTIGNGVTSIGNYGFYGCTSLTNITVNATTPPVLSSNTAFDNTNNCTIYVPAASVDTYKAASVWSTYASRIQAIPSE